MTFETLAFIHNLLYNADHAAKQKYDDAVRWLCELNYCHDHNENCSEVREQREIVNQLRAEHYKANQALIEFMQKEWR